MTRVHLVRHGRTASNRERRTMGWLDEGIEPGWVRLEREADLHLIEYGRGPDANIAQDRSCAWSIVFRLAASVTVAIIALCR
jgi:hypothetical protein